MRISDWSSDVCSSDLMGPLINGAHRDKVKSYVDLGVSEGATLVVDGRNLTVAGAETGFFLGGCLFDHVTPAMRIYQEEIFGPVLRVKIGRASCRERVWQYV